MTFAQWLSKVDALFEAFVGLSVNDMPDGPWADYYGDDLTPRQAIEAYAEDWDDTGMLADIIS